MKIIIDQRESKKRVDKFEHMLDNQLIEFKVDTIEVGDYLLCDDNWNVLCAVEYKTYNDFVSSMLNGHLESQLSDMEGYERPYLFVVGNWLSWRRKCHINLPKRAIEGFRTKILYTYKTKMINYDTEAEALEAMLMLLARSKNDEPQLVLPERSKSTGNPNFDMLLSLDGIGPKTANKLIENGCTFMDFLSCCCAYNGKELIKKKYDTTILQKTIDYVDKLI